MTTTLAPEEILKTDARGRVCYTPERRALLLDEFEASGLSGAKFAALVGVKYPTFAAWAKKRRQQRGGHRVPVKTGGPLRWVEAMVQPSPVNRAGLKLHFTSGATVAVGDFNQVALAAALLRALEQPLAAC